MKRAFWAVLMIFISVAGIQAQEVADPNTGNKLMAIRSNSRDIAPVRKTNLHEQHMHRKSFAIDKSKRNQLRKKRAIMQKKRMLMKKKHMMQQKRMMQNRMMHNRRR